MKLSEAHRRTLLINLHQFIETSAHTTANEIQSRHLDQLISYPPNGGLTGSEKNEIAKLAENEVLQSALTKILASNAAEVLFSFLNLLDGTTDPETDAENWTGVMLVDVSEDQESDAMLHDEFFETYWAWREKRKNTNWKLDLLEE